MKAQLIISLIFLTTIGNSFAQFSPNIFHVQISKVIPMNEDDVPEKDGVLNLEYLEIELANLSDSLYRKGDTIILAGVDNGVLIFNKLLVLAVDLPQNKYIEIDSIKYIGKRIYTGKHNNDSWQRYLGIDCNNALSNSSCNYFIVKINADKLIKLISDALEFPDELELKNFEFIQSFSNAEISFDCKSLNSNFLQWEVTDNMGRIIEQGLIEIKVGKSNYKISVSGLKIGRYTFTLGTGSESVNENFSVIR